MPLRLRLSVLITFCSLSPLSLLAQSGASSPLRLTTSDPALQQAFDWAKAQALAYVGPSSDPVGPWYEAALPGRNAFCMRDVSHQTMGAYALGLAAQNHNMLSQFARNISASKDWASYWEIDRKGMPSSEDYQNDNDFWYNLPANFDVMSAALRMYRWTADTTYIDDPDFTNFYEHTLSDYSKRWNLEPSSTLSRNRIMNQHLSTGRFIEARGIPSYTEGQKNFVLGMDVLAAEYQAFHLAANLARTGQHSDIAKKYDLEALAIQRLIETKAWNSKTHHFYGFAQDSQNFFGDGDAFILYFAATSDHAEIDGSLSALEKRLHTSTLGIEEQSYMPEILYRYGATEEAYLQILDLSRPTRERREYPEVSYSIIGAIATGMMGVDVTAPKQQHGTPTVISTRAQLSSKTQWAELDNLPARNNMIDVRHDGSEESSLTNIAGPALLWKPLFSGHSKYLIVNGHKVSAIPTSDNQHHPLTTITITVQPNTKTVVSSAVPSAASSSVPH